MKRLFWIFWLCLSSALAQDLPDHDITLFDFSDGRLSKPRPVASAEGYDNQPYFYSDSETIYFTRIENNNADIWTWNPESGAERFLATRSSEYSPTVIPGSQNLSTVVVEAGGVQRLWAFKSGVGFELLFKDIKPVGYHAWNGEDVALFVLGEPHQLMVVEAGSEKPKLVAENIGRCLKTVPGTRAVSFTQVERSRHRLMQYDFASKSLYRGPLLPKGTEDYAWLDEKTILTSQGSELFLGSFKSNGDWKTLQVPIPLQGISRIAVSPDQTKVALVHLKAGWFR